MLPSVSEIVPDTRKFQTETAHERRPQCALLTETDIFCQLVKYALYFPPERDHRDRSAILSFFYADERKNDLELCCRFSCLMCTSRVTCTFCFLSILCYFIIYVLHFYLTLIPNCRNKRQSFSNTVVVGCDLDYFLLFFSRFLQTMSFDIFSPLKVWFFYSYSYFKHSF
jgi:hypothetical protein